MTTIDRGGYEIGYLDTLSRKDTFVHALDPRAKILTTLLFVVLVVSFDRYEVSGLLPFFLYPVFMAAAGGVPAGYLLRRLAVAAPFAIMIGMFNPLLDRQEAMRIGWIPVSAGWISLLSMAIRFALTVGAAITLVAVTGFDSICCALDRLGAPRLLVVQMLFLYRYMSVLVSEAASMSRARAFRSAGGRGKGIWSHGSLLGHLLLRAYDRARRIHLAMVCRGFDGEFRMSRPMAIGTADVIFVIGWAVFLAAARLRDLPGLLGVLVTGAGR